MASEMMAQTRKPNEVYDKHSLGRGRRRRYFWPRRVSKQEKDSSEMIKATIRQLVVVVVLVVPVANCDNGEEMQFLRCISKQRELAHTADDQLSCVATLR